MIFIAVKNTLLPLAELNQQILSFGTLLSPVYLRREISRRVSCYALFKRWLLLSQLPRCLRNLTTLICT